MPDTIFVLCEALASKNREMEKLVTLLIPILNDEEHRELITYSLDNYEFHFRQL